MTVIAARPILAIMTNPSALTRLSAADDRRIALRLWRGVCRQKIVQNAPCRTTRDGLPGFQARDLCAIKTKPARKDQLAFAKSLPEVANV